MECLISVYSALGNMISLLFLIILALFTRWEGIHDDVGKLDTELRKDRYI